MFYTLSIQFQKFIIKVEWFRLENTLRLGALVLTGEYPKNLFIGHILIVQACTIRTQEQKS